MATTFITYRWMACDIAMWIADLCPTHWPTRVWILPGSTGTIVEHYERPIKGRLSLSVYLSLPQLDGVDFTRWDVERVQETITRPAAIAFLERNQLMPSWRWIFRGETE